MFSNADIQSANHVAAAQSINHTDTGQEGRLIFTSNIRVRGEKYDLSGFEPRTEI